MINILYDLQLSVLTSLQDGDFIFTTDSNVNVAAFTINGLLTKNKEYHFYVLVPPSEKLVAGATFTEEFIDPSRVTLLKYPYFGNPFVERVSFNPRELMNVLGSTYIDLVYTNDPSKVMQYKTFFYMKQNEFVKIISRNHWVTGKNHRKVPEEIDFIVRQVEGAIYSDASTFNSHTAKGFLLSNAKEHFNKKTIDALENKLFVMETVNKSKLLKLESPIKGDKKIILFPHRLSYYTGFEEVLEVLDSIYKMNFTNFELILPDPGNKFKQSELKAAHPYLREIDKSNWSHEDYLRSCLEADIVIGNHNIPTTWGGLALTEPMCVGTAPAMPKKDAYLEMFWSSEQDVFFKNKNGLRNLLLRYLTDDVFLQQKKRSAEMFCDTMLSMNSYIDSIENIIDKLVVTI